MMVNLSSAFFDKKGYPVLSESGEPGSLDDMYNEIKARLHGGYASKKFLQLHENCLLSARVTPSVEKTQRGILIKAGRNLVHLSMQMMNHAKPIFSNL
ncbi:hypothetical protein ACLB1O_06920 [Escherichia coli]